MPTFKTVELTNFAERIFKKVGTPVHIAKLVSSFLIKGNLAGMDSHGVIRIFQYLQDIESKQLDPKAEPTIAVDKGAITVVDGHHGFGQLIADYGIDLAVKKVKVHGMSVVALRQANHIGRLGEYLLKVAKEGFVGFAVCNGGGPNVVPFGAVQRIFGTNPIACAVPVKGELPILIDASTGMAAEGRIRVAKSRGESVPLGILADKEGVSTVNPSDFYDGGAILPIGGNKGSAFSFMVEVLGGILTGAGCPSFSDYDGGNGVLFIVLDPAYFRDKNDFLNDIGIIKKKVKKAKPAKGFKEVLIPGEQEFNSDFSRKKKGIFLDKAIWQKFREIARNLSVDLPESI